jgi:hypothetical protein
MVLKNWIKIIDCCGTTENYKIPTIEDCIKYNLTNNKSLYAWGQFFNTKASKTLTFDPTLK